MSPIAANLQAVRRRISEALQGDSRAVTLVAVSKARAAGAIEAAIAGGCRDFGENYVQEALPKIAAFAGRPVTWHFIGQVQGNKARDIAAHFQWVHGIDRAKIAQALARHRGPGRPRLDVCIQVNISREATKAGVEPGEVLGLAREVVALPELRLRGLMGMATPTDDVARQRAEFATLRGAFESLRAAGFEVDTLSMGMTQDFEAAIAEGATMVRIGTAIFGERDPHPGPLRSSEKPSPHPHPGPLPGERENGI
jgi:pyridoxal phosphate enzyme (YggS family)